MAEIKTHRTRRIGGYGKFCATRRSVARARLGVAWFFNGLLAGRENKTIKPGAEVGHTVGKIERRDDLGGLLRYYYRAAWPAARSFLDTVFRSSIS